MPGCLVGFDPLAGRPRRVGGVALFGDLLRACWDETPRIRRALEPERPPVGTMPATDRVVGDPQTGCLGEFVDPPLKQSPKPADMNIVRPIVPSGPLRPAAQSGTTDFLGVGD